MYILKTKQANSLSFSGDQGRMLENTVFIHLRRLSPDILYYKDTNSECDFLIRKNESIIYAIQVCWHLTNENIDREVNGIRNALKETGAKSAAIITFDQEDKFADIPVIPAWKWMRQGMVFYES